MTPSLAKIRTGPTIRTLPARPWRRPWRRSAPARARRRSAPARQGRNGRESDIRPTTL